MIQRTNTREGISIQRIIPSSNPSNRARTGAGATSTNYSSSPSQARSQPNGAVPSAPRVEKPQRLALHNPTPGSGWLIQILSTRNLNRSLQIPPTVVGGLFKFFLKDLKYPPTSVGGIPSFWCKATANKPCNILKFSPLRSGTCAQCQKN